MRRRLLAVPAGVVAGAVAALLAGSGCTRDPSQKLRFMIWGAPDEIKVVQGYLDDFAEAHPEIPVQVEHAPSMGYSQKLRTLLRGDNLPDVMYLGEADLEWFADQGALLDLTELAARDRGELDPDDFYAPIYERFRRDGRLYGIAKDFATLVLYYNRDLFDKWDVAYPEPGWTWDDFLATARALSREGDYGFLLETWPEELFPWIWQAGGEVASEDPPAWLMGKPEHIEESAEALQFLSDLIWVHEVAPGPSMTRDQQGSALFQQGRVAMCTYGRWACMEFRHITEFDWDVVELPRHRERATSLFAVSYAIGANTRHREEAWTLVKFLTSPAAQREVAHSAQAIPSRESVATSEAFHAPRALEGFDVAAAPHFEQVPIGRFSPRFPTAARAKTLFGEGVEPLWNRPPAERGTAIEVLRALQPKIEAAIAARQRED